MANRDAAKDAREGSGTGLERSLGTPLLALYGAGTILGAGIYVLVGEVAGAAGGWAPLAFAVAALVGIVNGMVYAELATRSSTAGGPADYVREAFDRRWLAQLVGWMIVVTGVVSAATITTGFSGYVAHFWDVPEQVSRAALLVVLAGVAAGGAKESAWFMAATTTVGVLGLGFVTWVGFADGGSSASFLERLPPLSELWGSTGFLAATFLAVYAYIGFEDLVHMAEEVERPARSMPRAIGFAIGISAVLYIVVSIAALAVLTPDELASSRAPLVAVVESAGYPTRLLTLASLAIILNGALAQIVMASRVLYSLARRGGAPGWMGSVSERTSTPVLATLVAAAAALLLALFLPLRTLAAITSFVMLLVFASSNAALIRLERREPDAPFDVPVWLPWVGLVTSLGLAAASFLVAGGH
jgi:amino acid transporter